MQKDISVKIKWKEHDISGKIEFVYGELKQLCIASGTGQVFEDGKFKAFGPNPELCVTVNETSIEPGAFSGIVRVKADKGSFAFFLRDTLYTEHPVYIEEYGVLVTSAADSRSYDEIVAAITTKGLQSDFERYEQEVEESYAAACASDNRSQCCPTWLGVPRDMRIFRVGVQDHERAYQFGYWGEITPANHSFAPQVKHKGVLKERRILFEIGQGVSCKQPKVTRRLEQGVLPILHGTQSEGTMSYNLTFFTTLESSLLKNENIQGTDVMLAYACMEGNMLPPEDREKDVARAIEAAEQGERIILCASVEAVNNGDVPQYAWIKMPHCNVVDEKYISTKGFVLENEKVSCINRFNKAPALQEEMAVLLQPGQKTCWEFYIPHTPVSMECAEAISSEFDFDTKLSEVRSFWNDRLAQSASFEIPEFAINELMKAGTLHCDIAAVGSEPDGAVGATVGGYAPIGSESSPIIQYFDSIGLHKLAERSIDFFLKRQFDSGLIQNFNNYQLETGPLLWTMGEHFRYTRDEEWLRRVKPNLDKAVAYLLKWRERNKKEELRPLGCYGILDGKVADPDDFYHSFMLNGLSFLGLKRALEMYQIIDSGKAKTLHNELIDYRNDIRHSYYFALANAPVVPTGNGTWTPFPPPWVENNGALSLYADGQKCFTHGSFLSRDSLLGTTYLVLGEVLDANEIGTSFMLKANQTPATVENAALTQPYYSRHDYAHLKRGEVKPYLKTYYNQLTGLIDRETYTFWEHYYHEGQHKTHEEAWFLMQTRWMLYLEEGDTLKLFPAIPCAWLVPGNAIKLNDVVSYFGKLNFSAEVSNDGLSIQVKISCSPCSGQSLPRKILVRLPQIKPRKRIVLNDKYEYDALTETIQIDNFNGKCEFVIQVVKSINKHYKLAEMAEIV